MKIPSCFTKFLVLLLALALVTSSCVQKPAPIPPDNGTQPTLPPQSTSVPTSLPALTGKNILQSKLARIQSPSVPGE